MTPTICATALGRRYRDQIALDDVSLTIEPGTVTGLLGRNGAGKTTLMRIITGQEFPTAGDLRVFGQVPAENDEVLRRVVFVREEQSYPDFQVRHAIRVASWFYPNWSEDLAQQLLEDFDLPPRRRIKRLLLVVVTVSMTDNWSAAGHFFTTVTALALTGVLATVAVAMGFGGLTTVRRVTI